MILGAFIFKDEVPWEDGKGGPHFMVEVLLEEVGSASPGYKSRV